MTYVSVRKHSYERRGHGGCTQETDYDVLLHGDGPPVLLRRFGTHGSMTFGYWGSRARTTAKETAREIAGALGQPTPPVFWSER